MIDLVLVASLGLGGLAGTGVVCLVAGLTPATPALGQALRRLHPELPEPVGAGTLAGPARRWLGRLPVPAESLALLGYTTARYHATLLVAGFAGLALPVVAGVMAVTAGRPLPGPAVAGGSALGLAAAAGFALVAHAEVRFRAARVRREARATVAVYLSLVAMQRGAGHGTVESLERAAQVGTGPAVRWIRQALVRARVHHRPPWEELTALGDRLGVPELGDLGRIMRGSGGAGAQVDRTLLERAGSLRDQIRADALARAEAVTGRLEIPGAVLLFILAAFVLYPITQQVYTGIN